MPAGKRPCSSRSRVRCPRQGSRRRSSCRRMIRTIQRLQFRSGSAPCIVPRSKERRGRPSALLILSRDGVLLGAPIDPDRIALGIQQPWAELILRGIKTVEIRSRPTRQRGPIYLYASKRPSPLPAAGGAARRDGIAVESPPSGLLVGTINLVDCRPARSKDQQASCVSAQLLHDQFAWELSDPQPFDVPLTVRFLPYGVWFYPFKRRPPDRSGRRKR